VIQVQAYPRVTHAHPTKALSVVSSSLAQAMRRLLVGVALATSIVFTQAPPSFADGAPFSRKLKQNTTIISNELSETSVQEEIQINEQAIVGQFGQITVPVNEHFTDAQIVEAATIKADGRRLDVPQDKILVSSQPNAPFLGIFMADVKFRTIVFPDVAAGDKVYYAVRSRGRNPLGGGFQLAWAVTPGARFDEVSITLDLPAEMSLHTAMADLPNIRRSATAGGASPGRLARSPTKRTNLAPFHHSTGLRISWRPLIRIGMLWDTSFTSW